MTKGRIIGVVGLGYVGLPVAVAFGQTFKTIGFDVHQARIQELQRGHDRNCEFEKSSLLESNTTFTSDIKDLAEANFFIVAVPTPIDTAHQPDLTLLRSASETVGKCLKPGDVVVYESTVYPGVTEEECLPILEKVSGLSGKCDFKIGYSPERINPGDKEHTFTEILKVVSGQDEETLEMVAQVYQSVVTAGVYRAPSIRVAEAAKVIENTQRDLNIAFMNELAVLFDLMDLDTKDVLDAAGSKWNFLNFKPGFVGGHCIGVDPYYLTHKATTLGYHPQVILAGRRINDDMGTFVAQRTIKEIIKAGHDISKSTVTVLGLTFKEDCPDIRNSRVVDLIRELQSYGINVQVNDPLADSNEVKGEYEISLKSWDELLPADAIVVAVSHRQYRELSAEQLMGKMKANPVLVDVKGIFDVAKIRSAGIQVWRL